MEDSKSDVIESPVPLKLEQEAPVMLVHLPRIQVTMSHQLVRMYQSLTGIIIIGVDIWNLSSVMLKRL